MTKKRSRTGTKPVPTPRAPLNLHLNRRTSPRSRKLLLSDDELSLELGEEYVRSVTSGEYVAADIRDEEVPEEHGGPFITTDGEQELAYDVDESNPIDAEPAALPTVSLLRLK